MASIQGGSNTAGVANVSAKHSLSIVPETDAATNPDNVGGVRIFSENDAGTLAGTPLLRSPETSQDYRLRVGIDTILYSDTFNATAQNTDRWSYTFNTLTAAQPGAGTVNFSNVQGTTSAHGAFMRTFTYFPIIGTAPLAVEFTMGQFTAPLITNEVWLAGVGLPAAATTIPTDGVWFQVTSAGLIGVLVYNGVTTQTGVLKILDDITLGDLKKYIIVIGENSVSFWLEDLLLGRIASPASNGQPFMQAALPIFLMKYNTGAVSNTNTMRVSDVTVSLLDINTAKPWANQLAVGGRAGYIGQNGNAQGKTSLWTNNTAPTAVALTNTAAAFTGLGGIVAVLPTLAANTDGKLITFQVPAGTINITGRNLVIFGVRIQGAVSVILAGGPVIYAYALAFGHTATTLVTAETASFANATTHAPRILPLGFESYAATAAVGTIGQGVEHRLTTPVVVRPGEFIDIVARNIGTVTTTGAITAIISFDAYWE